MKIQDQQKKINFSAEDSRNQNSVLIRKIKEEEIKNLLENYFKQLLPDSLGG